MSNPVTLGLPSLSEAHQVIQALMQWMPDDLDEGEMPSEWTEALQLLTRFKNNYMAVETTSRPDSVADAYCAILDAYGYNREGCWHDPGSLREAIEMEGWDDQPETAPGACIRCFAVVTTLAGPRPLEQLARADDSDAMEPRCKCGGVIRSVLSLAGYVDEEEEEEDE